MPTSISCYLHIMIYETIWYATSQIIILFYIQDSKPLSLEEISASKCPPLRWKSYEWFIYFISSREPLRIVHVENIIRRQSSATPQWIRSFGSQSHIIHTLMFKLWRSLFQFLKSCWIFGIVFISGIGLSNTFFLIGLASLNLNSFISIEAPILYHYHIVKGLIHFLNEVHILSFCALPLICYFSEEWTCQTFEMR